MLGMQRGITMLELLLVLVIVSLIAILSINQYQVMKEDRDAQLVQQTVDVLFQGMAQYYQANCRNNVDPTSGAIISHAGSLDPSDSSNPTATNPYPIMNKTTNLLLSNGFLTSGWPPAINSLVDLDSGGAGGTSSGFITQFNLVSPIPTRTSSASYYNWAASGQTTITMPSAVGKVYLWRAQVAMKLPANLVGSALLYKGVLGADCVSSLNGTTVTPCSSSPAPGGYLVWERLPSRASPNTMTSLWPTMSKVRQFKQMYTNDDMYGATNPTWANSSTVPNNNYLCGE